MRPDAAVGRVLALAPSAQVVGTFADNVTVLIDDTGLEDVSLEDYLDLSVDNAPNLLADFVLVRRAVMDGRGLFEFTATVKERPLHFLTSVLDVDGKRYLATFTATEETYAAGSGLAEAVLLSLREA